MATARRKSLNDRSKQICAAHLRRWLDNFELSNFHIVLFDEIQSSPQRVLDSTLAFIGVDLDKQRKILPPRNVTRSYRSGRFRKVTHQLGQQAMRKLGPKQFRILQRTGLPRLAHRLNERPPDRSTVNIEAADRTRLMELFSADIELLASLIGRDLSVWLEMPKTTR